MAYWFSSRFLRLHTLQHFTERLLYFNKPIVLSYRVSQLKVLSTEKKQHIYRRLQLITFMLFRLTSTRQESLSLILCSVSSTLVGFGGSSKTGNIFSPFTISEKALNCNQTGHVRSVWISDTHTKYSLYLKVISVLTSLSHPKRTPSFPDRILITFNHFPKVLAAFLPLWHTSFFQKALGSRITNTNLTPNTTFIPQKVN